MEQWNMPKVVIEKFRSNQYVAACTVDVQNYSYIDLATNLVLWYVWGVGDGEHLNLENIGAKNNYTISFVGPIFDGRLGTDEWYTGIWLYGSYNGWNGNYNTDSGSGGLDVYVYERNRTWYADVYTKGASNAAASGKDPANHS